MHLGDAVTLLIFSLGAFIIPLGTGRIGLPAAIGEILFGMLMGPRLAGLIHNSSFTFFLAEIGFSFLMFLAGLELDFPRFERAGRRNLIIGCIAGVMFFFVSMAITLILGLPLFIFLVFGATSLGLAIATLAELGITKRPVGLAILFVGSVGEFFTIILATAMGFYYRYGIGFRLLIEMGKLAVIFVAAYLVLVLLRTLIWWWPQKFSRIVSADDPSEIGVRAGLALMLIFVALALILGVEGILGAFVAGALFSFVFRDKGILETKLASIGFGFFIPFFFIWVGTEFDLSVAVDRGALTQVGLFFMASLVTKLLPSLLLTAGGLTLFESIGVGLLLGAPLTLLVAISRIGMDVKVIDKQTSSAIVLLAIVTSLLLPWLFRYLMMRIDRK